MNENTNQNNPESTPSSRPRPSAESRRRAAERRRREVRMQRITLAVVLCLLIIAAALISALVIKNRQKAKAIMDAATQTAGTANAEGGSATAAAEEPAADEDAEADGSANTGADASANEGSDNSEDENTPASSEDTQDTSETNTSDAIAQADLMAAGYDYDGAIDYLNAIEGSADNSEIQSAIARYQEVKATCVAVDVTTVPHIFYHSLVNEPDIAFSASLQGQSAADGMNAWMTTVDEFDKITQELYDRGYVYVRLRDLVNQTTDADGTVHFSARTDLMLPPDKKAIVLSIDDLAYYHSYKTSSFPDKMVLDENGLVKCHYVKPDGTESVGDYDVVPRLNTFLREHPDGSYKGARGLIALTGYNGVFGYRTDIDYEKREHLMADQAAWLEEHPDFNRQSEIEQATVIADAIKSEGWEFASHTWGHLSVTGKSAEELLNDNQKWLDNVGNIVGKTDTIIFAHGNDIGDWMPYSSDNDKFNALKNAGYNFYCNVDGSVSHWVQINDNCVRQGRIDLDGYMLYQASIGATTTIDDLVTASEVFDQKRPTPVVANGQG